jgi:N-acetylglucosamine-6-phosphate deacetylase
VTTVLHGRIVTPNGIIDEGLIAFDDEHITAVESRHPQNASTSELPDDALLLPGLVDMHCHGGGGGEFGPDEASARQAADHHHRSGTTTVVASLVSAQPDVLVRGMDTCALLAEQGLVAGVHTEGPFLSKVRCGAQDPEALTPVNLDLVDSLAAASRGQWRVMTFAPELTDTAALVKKLAALGVRPAVGHTDATAGKTAATLNNVRAAVGGPALVTHLFNGMPSFHHRSPGPVAAALGAAGSGHAIVELVADGVHIADDTAAMVLSVAATGSVALVTDAMAACGMPDGQYTLGRRSVIVADGEARLADSGALAGGVATLLDMVRRCVTTANVPLPEAVQAASWVPAQALGISDSVGALLPGHYADILAVDGNLQPVAVWRRGHLL